MEKQKSPNCKILISGCGMSFGAGERPTWIKVLKLCGLDITDLTGPGVSNTLITNNIIEELYKKNYTHVICQITSLGKLDVELTKERESLMKNDSIRNYSWKGYWPSSYSEEHISKKHYYKYLYSKTIEEKDLIIKLLHIQKLCNETNTKLLIFKGLKLIWSDPLHKKIKILKNFDMNTDYKNSKHYEKHDHSSIVVTPVKEYQINFAKKINDIFLNQNLPKLSNFKYE